MHAVVVNVTVGDPQAAQEGLRNEVVPFVKQAPGFVTAYWTRPPDSNKGLSFVIFETEDQAKAMAENIRTPSAGNVTIDNVEVREVVAHA